MCINMTVDKTLTLKFWQNSKTKSSCEKYLINLGWHITEQPKLCQNSKDYAVRKLKLQLWQNNKILLIQNWLTWIVKKNVSNKQTLCSWGCSTNTFSNSSFSSKSSNHHNSQTVRARDLNFDTVFTTRHVSCVKCHVSFATCHLSHVMHNFFLHFF